MTTLFLYPIAAATLVLGFPIGAAAQAAPDSGGFIVRRGPDTVATERFTRTATRLEGTLALRNPKQTSERYSAVIAPDATLPLIEVTVREGADSGGAKAKIVQRARVIFKEDSAAVDEMGNAGIQTRVFGTESGAVPYLNLSFALLEQAVRRARAVNGGSQVAFFNLGGGQTLLARLSPLGVDSLRLDIGDTRMHLRVDSNGRLIGGRIPVQDLVVERQ
ncbi:MAG TPA: hypothetical protein VFH26_06285 [Gemmatimonadales bacterium]|nr:hypothetical protein [Gemmatimonadales bacterium]